MKTIHRLIDYVHETLNISLEVEKWDRVRKLPIYMNDTYVFYKTGFLGISCVLMVSKEKSAQTPAIVKKHISLVQNTWDGEIIYVHANVTAFNRKRLIEQKVPFIIPGNQMYLPFVGIDLREHYRQIKEVTEHFRPSTQAVILFVLNNKIEQVLTPSFLAEKLGYSVMTLSRALDEIESASLGNVEIHGRERILSFKLPKRELWENALKYLSSPVKNKIWIEQDNNLQNEMIAGLSALALYSNLAQPANPVRALTNFELTHLNKQGSIINQFQQELYSIEIEIWSYTPRLFSKNNVVDKYSLFLSLKDVKDERVQTALEQMMETIEW